MNYICISDGAYSSSRNKSGVGIIIVKNDKVILEYAKSINGGTNNTAEILGLIYILKFIQKPIDSLLVISDSKYALECGFGKWQRKKNKKLWELFDKEYKRVKELCPNISYKHIKGHQKGNNLSKEALWNQRVDYLAVSQTM